MWFGRSKDYFFPVVNNEVNCASDKLVETTKTSLPCSPAVDQSVSWISRSNSVRLRILLSRIPCTVNKSPPNYQFGVLDTKSLIRLIRLVVCILTHPTGSSKYGTTRKIHNKTSNKIYACSGTVDLVRPVKSQVGSNGFRRKTRCLYAGQVLKDSEVISEAISEPCLGVMPTVKKPFRRSTRVRKPVERLITTMWIEWRVGLCWNFYTKEKKHWTRSVVVSCRREQLFILWAYFRH